MEEKQVSVEGATRPLPEPFFVIATQNPQDQLGTFALPESQLDRFLMRISLGYPDRAAERLLLAGSDRRDMVDTLQALADCCTSWRRTATQRDWKCTRQRRIAELRAGSGGPPPAPGKLVPAGSIATRRHCAHACGQGASA
jgi:MoxR-like ATPase